MFLPKSLGRSRLSGKIAGGGGGPPISGFIAFLLTSVLKFAWRGYYIFPPTSPHPPLCIYEILSVWMLFLKKWFLTFWPLKVIFPMKLNFGDFHIMAFKSDFINKVILGGLRHSEIWRSGPLSSFNQLYCKGINWRPSIK
jgi:hypothetical protein